MRFTTHTPDPMWGAIPLTAIEASLLEAPALSRLGQIKQMGLAFLDYPTLTHTRLEHSIGVLHVADAIYTTLYDNARVSDAAHRSLFGPEHGSVYRQAVRLAALLHDIGHPPFSHAVELTFTHYPSLLRTASTGIRDERERELFTDYSHETFTRWRIERLTATAEIRRLLGDSMVALAPEIARLAIGKATDELQPFNAIISGDFDADRIDYLIRDNRRSGFAIGLQLDELEGAVHLRTVDAKRHEVYIDATALPFVNSVLAARHRLIRRVHLAPAGRTATQMLINCLFGVLGATRHAHDLRSLIIGLHERCTDFTFYHELRRHYGRNAANSGRGNHRALTALERYFVTRFRNVMSSPTRRSVWTEAGSISFMQMHPCVRLLAHIAEAGEWESPAELTFKRGNDLLFLEPSAKSAQWSDLMVDYAADSGDYADGDPTRTAETRIDTGPSFDFIGATENRVGRAILVQSSSNLDGYLYRLDRHRFTKPRATYASLQDIAALQKKYRVNEHYLEGLGAAQRDAAIALAVIGTQQREKWEVEKWGMIAADYTLLVLYALDRHVRKRWPEASDVYVYSAERFVNEFLPLLFGSERTPVLAQTAPEIFRPGESPSRSINQKRVFSQIQRLAAYGLIITRGNSAYRQPTVRSTGATRSGVYTTREEIQINAYGRFYVENELMRHHRRHCRAVVRAVSSRQVTVEETLAELAGAATSLEHDPRISPGRVEALERARSERAIYVHASDGCAMTFGMREANPGRARLGFPKKPRRPR